MPVYEYMCSKKHRFTMIQKMEALKTIVKCPYCDSYAIRQMSIAYARVEDGTGRFHR